MDEKAVPDTHAHEASASLGTARYLVCEFFSGVGPLASAMTAAGVLARSPSDLAHGGAEFKDMNAVDDLWMELGDVASGLLLMVHFAPPYSTATCRTSTTWTQMLCRTWPFHEWPALALASATQVSAETL
jgi:hypothetical protein